MSCPTVRGFCGECTRRVLYPLNTQVHAVSIRRRIVECDVIHDEASIDEIIQAGDDVEKTFHPTITFDLLVQRGNGRSIARDVAVTELRVQDNTTYKQMKMESLEAYPITYVTHLWNALSSMNVKRGGFVFRTVPIIFRAITGRLA